MIAVTKSNVVKYQRPKRFRRHRHRFTRRFGLLFKLSIIGLALTFYAFPEVSTKVFKDRILDNQVVQSAGANTRPAHPPKILNGGNAWGGNRNAGKSLNSPPGHVSGNQVAGRVTHVRDGDTIEVSGVPVRIANLDCAETGSLAGAKATRHMKQLVASDKLDCQLSGRMSYDRHVGTCRLSNGRDIGEILIAQGTCRRWR